ncbi:hypothetical protein I551_6431 [Mycobacterium ulcerans str. Harvey]|uniref:Uncharacterized protein n=1 Tax=Mycobacterium ulcerans str. Harvey TaxID=1299332 RepID=A0ABN0QR32_MYCUL|nr:hypothetical protein I551_6431 [Mycobacterium ulcerans str. Harvey]
MGSNLGRRPNGCLLAAAAVDWVGAVAYSGDLVTKAPRIS